MSAVIMVTSECAPFVKVGGLAEVPYNLSLALRRRGYKVAIVLPRSGCKPRSDQYEAISESETTVRYGAENIKFTITELRTKEDILYYLIGGGNWQDREPYPESPDHKRSGENPWVKEKALEFCSGAHLVIRSLIRGESCPEGRVTKADFAGERVVVHAHDWLSAFVIPLAKIDPETVPTPPCMYTIHNYFHTTFHAGGEVHGVPHAISKFHLDWFTEYFKGHPEGFVDPIAHVIRFDRTGVYFADVVTSVSEDYKNALLKHGELSHWTRGGRKKFYGILNGIDTDVHSPAALMALRDSITNLTEAEKACGVSVEELAGAKSAEDILKCKPKAKALLLELLKRWSSGESLPEEWGEKKERYKVAEHIRKFDLGWGVSDPLVLMVGRVQWQKGTDIFLRSLGHIVEREPNIRYVVAGGGMDIFEGHNYVRDILDHNRDLCKKHALVINTFMPAAVRDLMYIAADVFVVPSRYEPCGLTPLEAMATGGTPSVVTPIGGLKEIVINGETGIHIRECRQAPSSMIHVEPEPHRLAEAIHDLLELEREDYAGIIGNCLKRVSDPSLSWTRVAGRYLFYYKVGIRYYWRFLKKRIEENKKLRKEELAAWEKLYKPQK